MDLMDEWVSDSNECFFINLTRPSAENPEPVFDEPFHPTFTYELYGEEQKLVGYKEPKICLNFRANDMAPSLDTKFKKKIDLSTIIPDFEQKDIMEPFESILPASAWDPLQTEELPGSDPTSKAWKPPGELLHGFQQGGKDYEIWSANLTDPVALQIFKNMQILVVLFIEGGSQLELDEDWTLERWTVYLLYEVTTLEDASISPYTLAGFSTSYRYWIFPTLPILRAVRFLPSPPESANGDAEALKPHLTQDTDTYLFKEHIEPLETQSRERISQFIILPPYQGQSLGTQLYETIYAKLVKINNIYEIAVEDPSEAFDAMRDYSDLAYLRKLPTFQALSLATSVPAEYLDKKAPIPRNFILGNGSDIDALRHEVKMVPRQFNRLLEMHHLSTIPPLHRSTARITRKGNASNENDRKYYFWRLAVKERIYRQSSDQLDQLEDPSEKVDLLEQAVNSQQDEYQERLAGFEKRMGGESTAQNGGSSRSKRKRVVIEEDDDDDDEGTEDAMSVASSKRVKG